jgi:hypothetical protein
MVIVEFEGYLYGKIPNGVWDGWYRWSPGVPTNIEDGLLEWVPFEGY